MKTLVSVLLAPILTLGPFPCEPLSHPGTPLANAAREADVARPASGQTPEALPSFLEKAVAWLLRAQSPDGGWGAGSHANQQERDPSKVPTDPGTTAFVGLSLLRLGNTPVSGPHSQSLLAATRHLVETIEKAPSDGPFITDLKGTQPQAKLGQIVDTTLAAQFLTRAIEGLPSSHELRARTEAALDKCLVKIQSSQSTDGSWNVGGWAPVLQSAFCCNTLEMAKASGRVVKDEVLVRARAYQKGNYDPKTGRAESSAGAGVELYAFASTQRATAAEARECEAILDGAKEKGLLAKDAPASSENLIKLGIDEGKARSLVQAHAVNTRQNATWQDENLLRGFGNNGGEEYLSYMFTSEALVLRGNNEWNKWIDTMTGRIQRVQNNDGSWSGHHCITSPVFCTAAVLQSLTADRDVELLRKLAGETTEQKTDPAEKQSAPVEKTTEESR
jgi:hypothetical protein